MNKPKYSREIISVVRYIIDPTMNPGEAPEGKAFPLILSKVNRRTISGKLRFFLDDTTGAKVFEDYKLPNLAEIDKWLMQCRQDLPERKFYPRLILAETQRVSYQLHYNLIPTVNECFELLDHLVEMALDYAASRNFTEEECQARIGDRNSGILSFINALTKDSIRLDDNDYEHWSKEIAKNIKD